MIAALPRATFGASRALTLAIWVVGALGAVALHAGGVALAVAHLSQSEAEEEAGAPSIEIGLEPATPHAEQTDLPPGPEAEASIASPAIAQQKMRAEESALPKAKAKETEDPDRLVAPDAAIKPEDEKPELLTTQSNASSTSVASEATALPTSEITKEAPRAVAPAQGYGASERRVIATWQKQLVAHLDRNKRYPAGAARRDAEIKLSFTLDRLGHVLAAKVLSGSGDGSFDEAALAMMRRADPVPKPPPLIADEGLTFTVPVVFRGKNGG